MSSLVGYTKTCALNTGGVAKLYLATVGDIDSFTFAEGEYTVVTMKATKVFKDYQFDMDTFDLKESEVIENNSVKVVHTLELYLSKMSDTSRTALEEIMNESACGLVGIVKDNKGVYWVVGHSENHGFTRPLEIKSGTQSSGKKLTDQNGLTLTLESEDNTPMVIFSGDIPLSLATISTANVTGIGKTGATTGGTVSASGGAPVTARGVVYKQGGVGTIPTLADSKTSDGTGTGTFTSTLSGLSASTEYTVRAYATTTVGTAYGTAKTFTTTS